MKVIIAGSRSMPIEAYPLVGQAVDRSGFDVKEVVCGMAVGADTLGHHWANAQELPVARFPAEWELYGRSAGPRRNVQMAEYADALIVFIWNNSRGSTHMLKEMQRRGKLCFVVRDGKLPNTEATT